MVNSPTRKKAPALKTAKIEARCQKRDKRRVLSAKQSTGIDESDFVIVALREFFARHKTPAAQIAAVRASREAAGGKPSA